MSVVQQLVTCVCKGISAGAGIIVGKLLGEKLFDRAKECGRLLCRVSFSVGAVQMALLLLLTPIAAKFFLLSDAARHYLILMLLFTAVYVFAESVNTVIVCGIFPAGGDSRYDAVSVLVASWCVSLPLALLGTFVFHLPVMPIYILMNIDEIIKLPWIYPRYKKYLWLNNLTRDEEK